MEKRGQYLNSLHITRAVFMEIVSVMFSYGPVCIYCIIMYFMYFFSGSQAKMLGSYNHGRNLYWQDELDNCLGSFLHWNSTILLQSYIPYSDLSSSIHKIFKEAWASLNPLISSSYWEPKMLNTARDTGLVFWSKSPEKLSASRLGIWFLFLWLFWCWGRLFNYKGLLASICEL